MLREMRYGALSGKARAMFGKLLDEADYNALIQKKSVSDVVSYLKHNTHYSPILFDIDEKTIHRSNLENILKKDMISDYAKFFKFTNGKLKEFIELCFTKIEIESLKLILRAFEAGNVEHDILEESLVFLARHDHLNIPKLSLSRDLDEFLSRLQGTDYYALLKSFVTADKDVRLFNMEMTLDLYYQRSVYRTYQKLLDKIDGSIIRILLGTEADIINVFWIYRSKTFYNMSPELIKSYLVHISHKLGKRVIEELINADGYEAYAGVLSKTPYGFLFEDKNQVYFEHNYHQYIYNLHKIHFRRQPFSIACIFSYLRLKEVEISNIISIIEGIQYKLSEVEIRKFVVGIKYI